MSVYLQDSDFTLHCGDALEVLRTLPDESVHMCVTSPPFYGLRDYGTGTWQGGEVKRPRSNQKCPICGTPPGMEHKSDCPWHPDNLKPDGSAECDHSAGSTHLNIGFNERYGRATGDLKQEKSQERLYRDTCGKCGATRIDRQIGLEESPEQWVQKLVEVFREVRRVLRRDGTLWLEVGDSYASQGGGGRDGGNMGQVTGVSAGQIYGGARQPPNGLKPKDLIGAPWLLAFALRADGWYLRSDIVWSRPNPMPESVTDRPTKSHSYVFLLTKSRAVLLRPGGGAGGVQRTASAASYGQRRYAARRSASGGRCTARKPTRRDACLTF